MPGQGLVDSLTRTLADVRRSQGEVIPGSGQALGNVLQRIISRRVTVITPTNSPPNLSPRPSASRELFFAAPGRSETPLSSPGGEVFLPREEVVNVVPPFAPDIQNKSFPFQQSFPRRYDKVERFEIFNVTSNLEVSSFRTS